MDEVRPGEQHKTLYLWVTSLPEQLQWFKTKGDQDIIKLLDKIITK